MANKPFTPRQRRAFVIISVLIGIGIATGLVLYALRQNINLYLTPTQVLQQHLSPQQRFRLGGIVVPKSVHRNDKTLQVQFSLSDFQHNIVVHYRGLLPSLFREGQGIVTEGHLNTRGEFIAAELLAKHDNRYHPPGVKSAHFSVTH